MDDPLTMTALGAAALAYAVPKVKQRLELSLAKHPSLAGHARMARRVAALVPGVSYDEQRFFSSDGAPGDVVARRRAALDALQRLFAQRFARSLAQTAQTAEGLSDLQFTGAYRVPFQYSRYLRTRLRMPAFLAASQGSRVIDLDDNALYDLTGSYGVNVFGYDFYRSCIEEATRRAAALGPVLGAYHPAVAYNVTQLRRISGLDEVSFHMSGTEAVMQAVRLARYHTRRSHLVRFCGAYHGWWEDVQPGPGNPVMPRQTYTLEDTDERALHVLRTRRDIACVLVNPLQALHPNRPAPGDSGLVDSSRSAGYDRDRYAEWLRRLRRVCNERGVVLIFDEVFLGFRLAPGGAQEYFDVRADLVTYGKTLGGGLPIGVVCGRAPLMRRFRDDRPADICFARGTFNAHPYVMCAMQVLLERLAEGRLQPLYDQLDERWNERARRINDAFIDAGLPLQVHAMTSVWTVCYTQPSRYNWMLQYYLRAHGLALSWVGTGRLIFSLDFSDADFDAVVAAFIAAGKQMRDDGWWWHDPRLTDRAIRRGILRELILHR